MCQMGYVLVTNVESKSISQMNFEGDEAMEDRELKMFIMSHTNLTIFAIRPMFYKITNILQSHQSLQINQILKFRL